MTTTTNAPSDIFVFDDLNPEDNAMVQALYSRSPNSVLFQRDKVKAVDSGKFMEQFYVGYGHASIGDCGSTTIFIENVSMLVAKAIQDNPLYSGQEASTRYLDFSKQPQYDPYNHDESKAILAKWIELYTTYMPLVIEGLKVNHPFDIDGEGTAKAWEKTIEVRAFDILRSLLPIGTTTLLSWHTNLRQARDHLRHLSNHPLAEVRNVAARIFEELKEKYPNSFQGEEMDADSERYAERNDYAKSIALDDHYYTPEVMEEFFGPTLYDAMLGGMLIHTGHIDATAVNKNVEALNRPKGAKLPKSLTKYGMYHMGFTLDFGSFRDLQRHRNGYCPVPLIDDTFGFYEGYTQELEKALSDEDYSNLMDGIANQLDAIESLSDKGIETNIVDNQYLYPMGMAAGCMVSYTVPQTVYVAELRSGKTVHFTLRPIAQKMGQLLGMYHPGLKTYIDNDPDSFTTKRGEQDIVEKSAT